MEKKMDASCFSQFDGLKFGAPLGAEQAAVGGAKKMSEYAIYRWLVSFAG